ncbi:MAG: ribosome small subunit-dependent GTPase A [Firmicutes bacterium HGW-Firmicutes-11]|jgi:ribosome biogenesis GTPase|nr:MAG: ribosome small subunit-dependent GTPase A [Firmicutes bacterium HGW-Firmicutes-11]
MIGVIVKGIGGFYFVKVDDKVYRCKARGIFRKEGIVPRVGDEVSIVVQEGQESVIDRIFPRRNEFLRPAIANVDRLIIVMAAMRPEPNLTILDRFLVMAEQHRTSVVICLNKIDLDNGEVRRVFAETYKTVYPLVFTSTVTGDGIQTLKGLMAGKKCCFAGPSGVGKSNLLNRLEGRVIAETGEISNKSQRGKHTTRHVELYELEGGGLVFDTPGFTSFDILEAEEDQLAYLYPEMVPLIGKCRYDNCRHLAEPDCRIRDAVASGSIHRSRYESYCSQMKEIQEKRKYQ